MPQPTPHESGDVPTLIFEQFCSDLKASGIAEDVIARLNDLHLKEGRISEASLKVAIFGEDAPRP